MKQSKIKVIKITEAGVELKEIENSLESFQKEVGGYIECVYPFKEDVCLVCNEEGKMNGSYPTMALYDCEDELNLKDASMYDIVFGDCFICGSGEEDLESIPENLFDKYYQVATVWSERTYEELLKMMFNK